MHHYQKLYQRFTNKKKKNGGGKKNHYLLFMFAPEVTLRFSNWSHRSVMFNGRCIYFITGGNFRICLKLNHSKQTSAYQAVSQARAARKQSSGVDSALCPSEAEKLNCMLCGVHKDEV